MQGSPHGLAHTTLQPCPLQPRGPSQQAGGTGTQDHPSFSGVGTDISTWSSVLPCTPQLRGWDLSHQEEMVLPCLSFPSCELQVIIDVVNRANIWQKVLCLKQECLLEVC